MNKSLGDKTESDDLRWSSLMESAQAGHEADYHVLLNEISIVIQRYLSSRFGQHDFVEDCVQDTLMAIHEARHTYDAKRRFRPWLFAIVRHKAIDSLRRQRSHHNVVASQRANALLSEQEVNVDQAQLNLMHGRLMDALAPKYREVIQLTKFHGLSTAEAAAHLQISESALKVRVHRAIGALKRLVQADAL